MFDYFYLFFSAFLPISQFTLLYILIYSQICRDQIKVGLPKVTRASLITRHELYPLDQPDPHYFYLIDHKICITYSFLHHFMKFHLKLEILIS